MRTRAEKPVAVQFPKTPERATLNAELQYRLELFRVLDRHISEAQKAQENSATIAWCNAMAYGRELILKGARESIKDLGPLTGHAQRSELKAFTESIGMKEEAA